MALEAFRHIRSKVSEYEWFNKEILRHSQSEEDQLALDVTASPYDLVITAGWPTKYTSHGPVTVELTHDTPPWRRLPSLATLIAAIEKVPSPGQGKIRGHLFVSLPHEVTLLYDEKLESSILLDLFRRICFLHWEGHRDQLCKSWIPISPLVFPYLCDLDLRCGISLQDCAHILFHFERLWAVRVDSIFKRFSKEPRLSFNPRRTHVDRPNLERLWLRSDDDITPLFLQFAFPSLKSIHLWLDYPTIGTFDGLDIWSNVQDGSLNCFTTKEDGEWIRNSLPPESSFEISPLPGVTELLLAEESDEEMEDFVVF
ncbi:hypothetical protein H0H92_004943 [Tricholoma furcatifolium]|nr:hypothetical protein H0H92_004943 [Tricholoma furcatifolium]